MSERLEIIEWRDAFHDAEQTSPEDWRADYIVRTVGWILREDELFVHLAAEVLPDNDGYRGTSHIPVPMILGRHILTTDETVEHGRTKSLLDSGRDES